MPNNGCDALRSDRDCLLRIRDTSPAVQPPAHFEAPDPSTLLPRATWYDSWGGPQRMLVAEHFGGAACASPCVRDRSRELVNPPSFSTMRRLIAEIEWPLEKDAGISSWRLIVAYLLKVTAAAEGSLRRASSCCGALPRPWRFGATSPSPQFANAQASVSMCFLSGRRCWRIGGGGWCSRGGNEFALRE